MVHKRTPGDGAGLSAGGDTQTAMMISKLNAAEPTMVDGPSSPE